MKRLSAFDLFAGVAITFLMISYLVVLALDTWVEMHDSTILCLTEYRRVDYIFPSRQIACWLTDRPGDKEKDDIEL